MNNKIIFFVFFVSLMSLSLQAQKPNFKIIAYSTASAKIDSIPYQYLTHINYSFAIPAKTGDTLEPIKNADYVKLLIATAKKYNVKVFLSIGGWGIGDGGGDDTRFHKLAETEMGQKTFVASCMKMVQYFVTPLVK